MQVGMIVFPNLSVIPQRLPGNMALVSGIISLLYINTTEVTNSINTVLQEGIDSTEAEVNCNPLSPEKSR